MTDRAAQETVTANSPAGEAFIQRLAEAKEAFSSTDGNIEPELREELWRVSNEFGVAAEFYTLDFAMTHFQPPFRVYAWRQFIETSLLRLEINALKETLTSEDDSIQGQIERGMLEAERRRRAQARAESVARHPSSQSGAAKQQRR